MVYARGSSHYYRYLHAPPYPMSNQDLSRLKLDRSASPHARPRRPWLYALILLIAIALAVFWLRGGEQAVETVSVGMAYPSQAYAQLNATGYVVASRRAAVASKATGRLDWLGVEEGSRVRQGQVIARLENKDMLANLNQGQANVKMAQARVLQSRADFTEAQAALNRAKDLLAKNFIAPSAYDTAVARHDKAQATLAASAADVKMAEAGLRGQQVAYDYTLIRAPFDGVVLTKQANVGDVITPFAAATDAKGAVVTMADMSTLEVEADVSESSLHLVSPGQACEIQLDAIPNARFRGAVSRIVPTVDRAKATVLVKVRFIDRDPRVLPDMSAKVAFLSQAVDPAHNQAVVAVNQAVITRRDAVEGVFIVAQGKAHWQPITRGKMLGDLVEVSAGLKGGETVVMKPNVKLREGGRVTTAAK